MEDADPLATLRELGEGRELGESELRSRATLSWRAPKETVKEDRREVTKDENINKLEMLLVAMSSSSLVVSSSSLRKCSTDIHCVSYPDEGK